LHWGEVKLAGQQRFVTGARMVVPRLSAGDVIVAHSFLAHGTSANTSDVRRDMIFQRRAAVTLCDPAVRIEAREAFLRNHWMFFRVPASVRDRCIESLAGIDQPLASAGNPNPVSAQRNQAPGIT
jgi:hypothetical protein